MPEDEHGEPAAGSGVRDRNRNRAGNPEGHRPYLELPPADLNAPDFKDTLALVNEMAAADQRALWIARVHNRPSSIGRSSRTDLPPTLGELATMVGISRTAASDAKRVLMDGDDVLIKSVERGEVALGTAVSKILPLPREDRAQMIARCQAGKRRSDGRLVGGTIDAKRIVMSTQRIPRSKLEANLRERLEIVVELLDQHFKPPRDEAYRKLWYRTLDRAYRTLRELRKQVAPAETEGPHEAQ